VSLNINQDDKYYTYEDYVALDDGKQYELHNGKLYMMSAPSQYHAEISLAIASQLYNFLIDKPCRVYHAPFNVKLWENEDTVYQPDVLVVCDLSKLNGKLCTGAPDFIVEVLSPSTKLNDKTTKLNHYRDAGVKEYWIVDPDDKTVMALRLIDKLYVINVYAKNDKAPIQSLGGFQIDLSLVFRNAP